MSETFRLTDLLNSLVLLEQAGQRLYLALAERHAAQPELRRIFTELAGWEKQHEALYARLGAETADPADDDEASPADPEYGDYLRTLMEGALHLAERDGAGCGGMRAALHAALGLEKDTLLFLAEVIPHLSAAHAATVAAVMREERRHAVIIHNLLRRS